VQKTNISLNSLRFSDKKGNLVVREDYNLIFRDSDYAEIFIQSRMDFWTELYSMNLVLAPDMNETLQEIEIKKVFKLISKFCKVPYKYVAGDSRKRIHTDPRKFGIIWLRFRKIGPSAIAHCIGVDHSTVSYHYKEGLKYMETDSNFNDKYYEIDEHLAKILTGKQDEDKEL